MSLEAWVQCRGQNTLIFIHSCIKLTGFFPVQKKAQAENAPSCTLEVVWDIITLAISVARTKSADRLSSESEVPPPPAWGVNCLSLLCWWMCIQKKATLKISNCLLGTKIALLTFQTPKSPSMDLASGGPSWAQQNEPVWSRWDRQDAARATFKQMHT